MGCGRRSGYYDREPIGDREPRFTDRVPGEEDDEEDGKGHPAPARPAAPEALEADRGPQDQEGRAMSNTPVCGPDTYVVYASCEGHYKDSVSHIIDPDRTSPLDARRMTMRCGYAPWGAEIPSSVKTHIRSLKIHSDAELYLLKYRRVPGGFAVVDWLVDEPPPTCSPDLDCMMQAKRRQAKEELFQETLAERIPLIRRTGDCAGMGLREADQLDRWGHSDLAEHVRRHVYAGRPRFFKKVPSSRSYM